MTLDLNFMEEIQRGRRVKTAAVELSTLFFFYKDNFIRTTRLRLGKKLRTT